MQLTAESVLTPVLGKPLRTSHGREIRYNCPFCIKRGKGRDENHHFYLNIGKEKYYCHRCKSRGTLTWLLEYLGIGGGFCGVDNWEDELLKQLNGDHEIVESEVTKRELPSDYVKVTPGTSAYTYLLSRGFTPESIESHWCGFGFREHKGLIIFPEWDKNGTLLYWTSKPYVSWRKNPKNCPGGKGGYVYWLEQVKTDYVVVTEAVFDAITFGESGCALLGSGCEQDQINSLIEKNFKTYYLAFDGDAYDAMTQFADALFQADKHVKLIILPVAEDPNSLGVDKVQPYIENAIDYFPSNKYMAELARGLLL